MLTRKMTMDCVGGAWSSITLFFLFGFQPTSNGLQPTSQPKSDGLQPSSDFCGSFAIKFVRVPYTFCWIHATELVRVDFGSGICILCLRLALRTRDPFMFHRSGPIDYVRISELSSLEWCKGNQRFFQF